MNERGGRDKETSTMRVMKAKEITGYCETVEGALSLYNHVIAGGSNCHGSRDQSLSLDK